MVDTVRTKTALEALLADNTTGAISPQDIRDLMASLQPAHGSLYVSSSAATTINNTNDYEKVAGTTLTVNLLNFDNNGGVNNRLRYTGMVPTHLHLVCSLSADVGSASQQIHARFYHYDDSAASGATLAHSEVTMTTGSTINEIASTAIHGDVLVDTNDYIEVHIRNATNANNITVDFLYFYCMSMFM